MRTIYSKACMINNKIEHKYKYEYRSCIYKCNNNRDIREIYH